MATYNDLESSAKANRIAQNLLNIDGVWQEYRSYMDHYIKIVDSKCKKFPASWFATKARRNGVDPNRLADIATDKYFSTKND